MSNSEENRNISETSRKLDALYKLTQQSDPGLDVLNDDIETPADIDASLQAKAHATLERAPADSSWQRRYGWATAATLLLSSVLFVSVMDDQPPPPAAVFDTAVDNTSDSAPQSAQIEPEVKLEAEAEAEAELEAEPPSFAQREAAAPRPSSAPGFAGDSSRSRSFKMAPLTHSTQQLNAAQAAAAVRQDDAKNKPGCKDYTGLLIGRICRFNANSLHESSDSEPLVFSLSANGKSDCAGQQLIIQLKSNASQPHPSSTLERFELEETVIVCKSGSLLNQSPAPER